MTGKILIPVIMEPLQHWPPGVVTLHLGRCMHVDASVDISAAAEKLNSMLRAYGLHPATRLSHNTGRQSSVQLPPLSSHRQSDMFRSWYRSPDTQLQGPFPPLTPPMSFHCPNMFRWRRLPQRAKSVIASSLVPPSSGSELVERRRLSLKVGLMNESLHLPLTGGPPSGRPP